MTKECQISSRNAGTFADGPCEICGEGPCWLGKTYPNFHDQESNKKILALYAIKTLIRYIGDDPDRAGLKDTPERVLKAWEENWGRGYNESEEGLVRLFLDDGKTYDEMVTLSNIQFYSTCEHHLAPFFGTAAISYIPDPTKGIVGLSKLARIVDHFSRRLQVQERLTNQIADFIVQNISPNVGIILKATHLCMVSRGVQQPNALTTTSALRGVYFSEDKARSEFLRLAQ